MSDSDKGCKKFLADVGFFFSQKNFARQIIFGNFGAARFCASFFQKVFAGFLAPVWRTYFALTGKSAITAIAVSIFRGPMVKRLRHRPFTAVTRVRVPVGSPNKLKANPFPLGDGFAFKIYFFRYMQ